MNGGDVGERSAALDWIAERVSLTSAQLDQLDRFVALLLAENRNQNLIARGTEADVWTRHILDSAQLAAHVPRETRGFWLDLGSGPGLPGLVCAILRPDLDFLLVEQRSLRADWLGQVARNLGTGNVSVAGERLSAVTPRKCAVISARAFAPLPKLLSQSAHFSTERTLWLLPKGRSAGQELAELSGWRHTFHVEQSVTDAESGIIVGTLLPGKPNKGRR